MAYLHDMFLRVNNMAYHGNGKFSGTCRYNTNAGSCLEMIVEQPNRGGDEQYYPWHGEFKCIKNCSKSKVLSNLNMRRIFFDPDSLEFDPEGYHCLFNQNEAKEFLKEEIYFIYKVLQKPEFEWKKELEGYDLRFAIYAIWWLQEVGRYCFAKKNGEDNRENPTGINGVETLINQSSDDMPF